MRLLPGPLAAALLLAAPAFAQSATPDRALVEDVVAANHLLYDQGEAGGDGTDMLVRNPALGAALAQKLGNSAVLLMRGHGDVVVGDSVRQVVFRAIYAEVNAKLESEALRLGEVTFLTDRESAASMATNAAPVGRAWDLWKAKAMGGRD